MTDQKVYTSEKIAIVGCGQIGSHWGTLFASAGYCVCLYDLDDERIEAGKQSIRRRLHALQADGLLRGGGTADEQFENVSGSTDLFQCLRGALYCQESIAESQASKAEMFSKLEEAAEDGTVLASSTSTIPGSTFTSHLKRRRSQCIVAHPINPPAYIRLVEVVPTPWTSEDCVSTTMFLMKKIGQAPVRLMKEVPGFALNRIQYAIIAESWRLVHEGILSPDDVDTVMTEGLGPRYAFYGPLAVMHLNANGIEDYLERFLGGVLKVLDTMDGPAGFEDKEVTKRIIESLNKEMPLDRIGDFAQRRERLLAELCKLKKRF